jgi:membrane protease YdiL (CAAX protease family)
MPSQPSRRLLWIAALFYCPMLISAYFVKPRSLLAIGPDADAYMAQGLGLGVAGVSTLLIVIGSRVVARRTAWGKILRDELSTILVGLNSQEILALALLSGFGEELLFRGVAMAYLGVWGQAAVFGLFHLPLRRTLWPWTLFALVIGVGLGWLTRWSGSLWPAVLLHFCVNYFNLHDLMDSPPPRAASVG